ncbi:MAG TPA: hypothetical protein VIH22_19500 [Cyclobacteriaceae bacterium]|jgi:hypothetical protein
MSRQKKIFAILAAAFVLLLLYASYDISQRTTFPGSKPQPRERLTTSPRPSDSLSNDGPDSADSGRKNPDF